MGEWPGLANPMQIFVRDDVLYMAESNQRVSIMTLDGEVLARWGSKGEGLDQFTNAPHSIWADSRGDVYVSEVVAAKQYSEVHAAAALTPGAGRHERSLRSARREAFDPS